MRYNRNILINELNKISEIPLFEKEIGLSAKQYRAVLLKVVKRIWLTDRFKDAYEAAEMAATVMGIENIPVSENGLNNFADALYEAEMKREGKI